VGTEGKLGGEAKVPGVSGLWKDLTENVNVMANNLTTQVRNIALVATGIANGDLSQKITIEAQGEVLALKETINSMVDNLNLFGNEVTRLAREVGIEGKLGGEAKVPGVSGTWRDLTENVLVDLDKNGNIVSMTIEHAREQANMDDFSFQQIHTPIAKMD